MSGNAGVRGGTPQGKSALICPSGNFSHKREKEKHSTASRRRQLQPDQPRNDQDDAAHAQRIERLVE